MHCLVLETSGTRNGQTTPQSGNLFLLHVALFVLCLCIFKHIKLRACQMCCCQTPTAFLFSLGLHCQSKLIFCLCVVSIQPIVAKSTGMDIL